MPKKDYIDEALRLVEVHEALLFFNMGIAYWYNESTARGKASVDYPSIGQDVWNAVLHDLHDFFCTGKKLKPGLKGFLEGNNQREILAAIITALIAQYSAPISIAIPAAAMAMKSGLGKFCSNPPPKDSISVRELIDKRRRKAPLKKAAAKKSAKKTKSKSN